MLSPSGEQYSVVEIVDERTLITEHALQLIAETFERHDRHSLSDLRSEVAEKRHDLLFPFDFHLLVMVDRDDQVVATTTGTYLAGINSGFVGYLAVHHKHRGKNLGQRLRDALVDAFKVNAIDAGNRALASTIGEVRIDNRWLHKLVRDGIAIPFDFDYLHPGMPQDSSDKYILYRQSGTDLRREIPWSEMRMILYAIYKRAYRVNYPLEQENFRRMLEELEDKSVIGPHQGVLELARASNL